MKLVWYAALLWHIRVSWHVPSIWRPVMSFVFSSLTLKNPWHSLTWFCQKCWHLSYDQSATTLIHCQVLLSFFPWTSCKNGFEPPPSNWVATYYLDEHHPRWSLFPGSGAPSSQRTGSESTSLKRLMSLYSVTHLSLPPLLTQQPWHSVRCHWFPAAHRRGGTSWSPVCTQCRPSATPPLPAIVI